MAASRVCVVVAVDENSVVVEVAGSRMSLPRDGSLEPPDTQLHHYRPLYVFRGECRR